MIQLLTTAGGVALILFGVRFLRKGLDRLFGAKLGLWIQRTADSRPRAFCTGIGLSVVAPSSTTMSILAVQSVQAGHMSARQMFALMLGADIGLTMMVLLIALRLDTYAPILLFIGVVLFQFTKAPRSRGIGQVVLALGFIFMAIGIIKAAAGAEQPSEHFIELINAAGNYPIILAMIAAVLTVAMQSSTATLGLVIGLSDAGHVNLTLAVAVVVGANVGIALSTLIVGWRHIESRRLGVSSLLAKTLTAAIVLTAMPWVLSALTQVPGGLDKQIAATHSGFNVLMAILFLPLVGGVSNVVTRWLPQPNGQTDKPFGPRYLDDAPIDSLALATGQSMREILRVSDIVRSMLDDLWQALHTRDIELARQVQDRDDQVDLLDREIKQFLTRLTAAEGDPQESGEIMRQLRYINELETIGDVIDKNLAELVIKRATQQIDFSDEGWAELDGFFKKVRENMLIAETAFNTRDTLLAHRLLRHKERLGEEERTLRDRHFARLQAGSPQTHESSSIHLDLLTHLKRINSNVTHVAYALVQNPQGKN